MSVVILRVSVDTLEVSFDGNLAKGLDAELDCLKTEAQDFGLAQRFRDSSLFVEPKAFGLWRWRLTCPDFSLVLSPSSPVPSSRPSAQIRLSAFGLSTREHSALLFDAIGGLSLLGEFSERSVSRLDVCADLQGWMPAQDEMLGMSCPAVYRGIHLAGRQAQTFQYGKGELLLRVYDKTAELDHSRKAWMREVWARCKAYDPALPVIRVESQMKCKPLREIRICSSSQALARAGDAFEWMLREWCQLRTPSGDRKVTRWPEHPVWTQLRAAVPSSVPCQRARTKAMMMRAEDAAARLPGLVAVYAAYYGGECSYIEALQGLSDTAEARMLIEHIDFRDIVTAKRKRLEAEMGWEPDVPF